MRSSSTAGFRKLRTCPQSEALMTYCQGARDAAPRDAVAAHAAACDFCGAEAQLLSRFPPLASALLCQYTAPEPAAVRPPWSLACATPSSPACPSSSS